MSGPSPLPKEVVPITAELHRRIMSSARSLSQPEVVAPFYWNPPGTLFSAQQRQQPVRGATFGVGVNQAFAKLPLADRVWDKVATSLQKIRTFANQWTTHTNNNNNSIPMNINVQIGWLQNELSNYNSKVVTDCNFRIIAEDQNLNKRFMQALPGIIDHALKLPARLRSPLPLLQQRENKTICLTRDLACSLLANAFLCTFPEPPPADVPYINFYSLFNESEFENPLETPVVARVKREKLKCFLSYFEQMSPPGRRRHPNTVITFQRRFLPRKNIWGNFMVPLCPVEVRCNEKLEFCQGMLQVDFANRKVGGGVLNDGAVQEEIRFCVSPELLCARLFTERLLDDEVLIVTGTRLFNNYTGYRESFQWKELDPGFQTENPEVDNLGREFTQVVAMDALYFNPSNRRSQYKSEKIQRELHKCFVAFTQGRHVTPVATGNWGCGAFHGDPQLKFLIQWMAASVTGRGLMRYHASDRNQQVECQQVALQLTRRNTTVAELYKKLIRYDRECSQGGKSVFQFVLE